MAAPEKNQNATRHGLRSTMPELAVAALTKRYPRICHDVRAYGQRLRAAVQEVHGAVSVEHEGLVNAACRFELASRIYLRLVNEGPDLPAETVADLVMKSTQAVQNRRAYAAKLGLGDKGDLDYAGLL